MAVNHRCNEQIRISPVRVIDENNEQLGVMPTDEAMSRARSAGMDLVEIAPTERPPVCRIMDYGKFKYGQKRRKQKSREQKLKEIRLHPDIGDHDRNIKLNQAVGFIEKGDKVQFTMIFRGRERFHQNLGFEMFNSIVEGLGERAKVERPPRSEGRRLIMVIAPAKKTATGSGASKEAGPA
ncbi:MAG: translation initiation factor IF-3 [Phycisphaerae bacterium]|nr:translation initiation factor IF-3 [Phycisphaerae bacterium]